MTSTPTSAFDLFASWNKLLEPFWGYATPLKTVIAEGQDEREGQEANGVADPWTLMLRQLWKANPWSRVVPLDPVEVVGTFQALWLDAWRDPMRTWLNANEYSLKYWQIVANTSFGARNTPPVVEPEKGDKRFSAHEWQLYPVFDFLKQSYLLTASTLLKTVSENKGLSERQQRKLIFYVRQYLDAISPTNTLFTNPQVLQETFRSGGQNLVKGMENLMRDLREGQVKMTDTDAFAPGRNLALTPGQVIYRNQLIELIQYAPTTEQVYSIPLLFLPPWINKYYILDMQPQNSLVKFLVDQGYTVCVVSWKNPDASMEETSFEDYMTQGLLAAMNAVKEATGSPQVNMVGYCIGGTLLSMALSYLESQGDRSVNTATFLVSLLDFNEVGETCVFMDEPQIEYVEGQMMRNGYLDSRAMATMFNMLRANDLIWSNVVNNYLMGKEPPAFDLLYWNNDGTRMARAAHSFYLRNTYLENNLVQPNKIVMKGVPIDLGRISQEIYAVGTQQDHIVPWQSAWRIGQLVSGPVRFVLAGSGHIAGVVSPPAKARGYWTNEQSAETAEAWLASATRHDGSWWTDWVQWLSSRSGEQRAARPLEPGLTAAPGTYVLEK